MHRVSTDTHEIMNEPESVWSLGSEEDLIKWCITSKQIEFEVGSKFFSVQGRMHDVECNCVGSPIRTSTVCILGILSG